MTAPTDEQAIRADERGRVIEALEMVKRGAELARGMAETVGDADNARQMNHTATNVQAAIDLVRELPAAPLREVAEPARCLHLHYDMVAHRDDETVGGSGWAWSPKCTDCGDDVPMVSIPEAAAENPTAFATPAPSEGETP